MLKGKKDNAKSDKVALTKILKEKLTSNADHQSLEQEKNTNFIILEIIEYIPNSLLIKPL